MQRAAAAAPGRVGTLGHLVVAPVLCPVHFLQRRTHPARTHHVPRTRCNAAHAPPELTGFWSTLIAEQLSGIQGLDPSVSYLISHGVGHLVVPIFEAWLVIKILQLAAAKVHAWCEANPERPLFTEVVGLLPGAIRGPTVLTLGTLVTVRMVYNAALLLGNYLYKFSKGTYSKAAEALLNNLCANLQPMGKGLVKVYSVVMLFYLLTVLVKWKSLGLSSLLERERAQQEALIEASGGVASKARSADDLERLLVPFDAATSWLMYAVGFVAAAQAVGVNIAPLVAVGGAGSIIIGLATQQLLTNAFMGLSLFFSRPFVDGDSVLVQGAGGMVVSGVVEKTTVMRTTLRDVDGVIVTIPNKTVADMIVFNRSADVRRSRLASANRQTENIKLRLKLPYAQEDNLGELQQLVKSSLEPPASSSSSSTSASATAGDTSSSSSMDGAGDLIAGAMPRLPDAATTTTTSSSSSSPNSSPSPSRSRSPLEAALQSLVKPKAASAARAAAVAARPSHPVAARSVEIVVSRFTDAGIELLVKAKLRVEPSDPMVQALLLDLSKKVRGLGAVMINV